MKKTIFITILAVFISQGLSSMDSRSSSVSFDPLTFAGLFTGLLLPQDGDGYIDLRNMWLSADINWLTTKEKEFGAGLFVRGDRVALITKYRMFRNNESQSGFFWGLFGLVEWRRMYWFFDNNGGLTTGWSFPFAEHGNVYHSIGITAGADVGIRFRINDYFGITPYLRAGIPLFYCFGNMPPGKYTGEFYAANIAVRVASIGLKLDCMRRVHAL
jgi:hypothetical protein